MEEPTKPPHLRDYLGADSPSNWGKWGPDDEIGALNYLTSAEALRGVREVRTGESFTLSLQMGRQDALGDPAWPGRQQIDRRNTIDQANWVGEMPENPGGGRYADDVATLSLQGSTQYDALGHFWFDDQIWNGFDAASTVGGMAKASILPIAEHGVVGRGVLLDVARFRGKLSLEKGETIALSDLLGAAEAQGVVIEKHDILLIRTGWLASWYRTTREDFYEGFNEPGLTYSTELVRWFQEMEIPNLVTDTIANETTVDPASGIVLPLHAALMRNLGVLFTEMTLLEDLAESCSSSGKWTFLYVAAPLKVVNGTGAPVNPIVIV